jgi:hypothetical protein
MLGLKKKEKSSTWLILETKVASRFFLVIVGLNFEPLPL